MRFYSRYNSRYNSTKPAKPADDTGDFDDIGKAKTASHYHYNQKRKLGHF